MNPAVDPSHLVFYVLTGFVVAAVCTPVGVSGAFLLVPFQVTVLGLSSVSVSSTGLVFNVISSPAGIFRYWRDGRVDLGLAKLVLAGSVPAVAIGAIVRVHLLTDPKVFKAAAGIVLLLLAARVIVSRIVPAAQRHATEIHPIAVVSLSAAAGLAGGLYGIGGGSLLAPLLVASGVAIGDVAGAALVGTFGSSLAGLIAYLGLHASGSAPQPFWTLGVAVGVGGLLGSYTGAKAHRWLPEAALSWLIAAIAGLTGALYLAQSMS